jgi:hypothetical protein
MAVNKKFHKKKKKGKDTQFSSENQPENRGRKPSVLSHIRKSGLSITDISAIIDGLMWEYDSVEITTLLKDKKNPLPVGIQIVLGALSDDMKTRSLKNWDILMSRSHGKPTQKVVADVNTPVVLTPEERRKRIEELLKKSETKPEEPGRKRTGRASVSS